MTSRLSAGYSLRLLLLPLAVFSPCNLAWANPLYGARIVAPADAGAELKASAADAGRVLNKVTGQEFTVSSEYTGGGIFLTRANTPAGTEGARLLKGKSRESFYIRSAGANNLQIVAESDSGLSHGLYFYLEQLGVRFFFPNENWSIVPRRNDITLSVDRVVVPDFHSRDFFGTGGFGPGTPVDSKLEMRSRWQTWQRRNRFGEEFDLGGHTGEAFNEAHKEILQQHPEYLAKVDGRHVPWSKSAKLNVANAEAVKLYVDWSLERYRKARQADPTGPGAFAVSVDPADSGGHCNSEECKEIGSGTVSDMVYYVANEVARAVRREFPDGWVSLLAYNQHAAVPTIELEPNIYVKVVPYAFQSTGLAPEELIRAWGKKVKRMSVYDYWAITDWAQNQPSFNYVTVPAAKLRLWRANNIEGFRGESTYSAGAMGIGWYVTSRLMWDTKADEKAIIREFYELAFGPAKVPMQRMLERWALDYQLDPNQLGLAYRDLQEARRLAANDDAVTARLDDYGKYLHYLRLWYEFQNAPAGSPERTLAAKALLIYLWEIYDSAMVQTTRTAQLILNRYAPEPELKAHFDYKNKNAPFWKELKPVGREQVERLLTEGTEKYPVLFQPAHYKLDNLKPLTTGYKEPGEWVTAPPRFGGADFAVLQGKDTGPIQLLAGKGELKARVTISRTDNEQTPVGLTVGEGDWVTLPVPATPGIYYIRIRPTGTFSYQLRAKPQAFLTALQSVEARKPDALTMFYVAPGQKTIAFYTPGVAAKTPVTVTDGDNRPVKVNAGMLKIIPVPAGQDGKLWTLRGHAGNRTQKMIFLNGPRVYGFSRAGMLVPADPVPLATQEAQPASPAPGTEAAEDE